MWFFICLFQKFHQFLRFKKIQKYYAEFFMLLLDERKRGHSQHFQLKYLNRYESLFELLNQNLGFQVQYDCLNF